MGRREEDLSPASFWSEEAAEERIDIRREAVRWGLLFAMLFGGVFFAFWWSGAALRFGAGRVADHPAPSWQVWGEVRNAATREAIPWAKIEDDPNGRPPFYEVESDVRGRYSLLTLAEPHHVVVSAEGCTPVAVEVGRPWFRWWPKGSERKDLAVCGGR